MEFNNIPSKGTFGSIAAKINSNFDIAKVAIGDIEYNTRKNKGLFATAASLTQTLPSPTIGDWALVGTAFPCAIYSCTTNGTWSDTEQTYAGDNVSLNEYLEISDFNVFKNDVNSDIYGIKEENEKKPTIDAGEGDLDIRDEQGNIIVKFQEGHILTKNFDSSKIGDGEFGDSESDFDIKDESGNKIVEFKGGHVFTKNFDSSKAGETTLGDSVSDLAIQDENGNIIVSFAQGHIFTKNFSSKDIKVGRKLRVLSIGNSFSYDAFSYLPPLLEDIAGMDVTFGILFKAGCTLAEHYDYITNNTSYTNYTRYTTNVGKWVNNPITPTISAVVASEDWDIIVLQQASQSSNDYTTYQPYLNNIISRLMQIANNAKIAWLITPSRSNMTNMDTFFAGIIQCVQSVISDTIIDCVIPCGTATHNARHTSLDALGDQGHLTYDQAHLQEGIPCLIESYAAAIKILDIMGYGNTGIVGNKIRPTQAWITDLNVEGQNGQSVGVNDANCILAQKCAIWANKKPFEITTNII